MKANCYNCRKGRLDCREADQPVLNRSQDVSVDKLPNGFSHATKRGHGLYIIQPGLYQSWYKAESTEAQRWYKPIDLSSPAVGLHDEKNPIISATVMKAWKGLERAPIYD